MSKRGQALIEAIAGLGLSVLFFTSCLKLWLTAADDLKKENQRRENQICQMARSAKCTPDAGFVLVTTLMQLTVLIFAAQVLIVLFLSEEFKWKISSWCFESGIAAVTGNQAPSSESLSELEKRMNDIAPGFLKFSTSIKGPAETEVAGSGLTESYYVIKWVTIADFGHFSRMFLSTNEFSTQFKCGARKQCHEKNCVYTVIADKS